MTIKRYFSMKRREFFGVAAASLSLPATRIASAADACEFTPSTDDGPLYPVEEIPWVSDLTRVEGGAGMPKSCGHCVAARKNRAGAS